MVENDKLDQIEKRLINIESRLSRLEDGGRLPSISPRPSEKKTPGPPIAAIILLIIGGYILLTSAPGLLFGYERYGYGGYGIFSILIVVVGLALVGWGAKILKEYRTRASKLIEEIPQATTLKVPISKPSQPATGKAEGGDKEQSFEFKLAANWFAIVGIVAIVFAVVFFLKFAFDNGLIGPAGQVITGLVLGTALIFTGEFLRSKVHNWSQIISGGGIIVLYLSLWAAYGLFHLVSPFITLLSMSVITVLSSLLAVRYAAVHIGVLGVIGGFATAILLGKGFDSQIVLMSYIIILNLGVLAVSFFKNWRELNIATFAGTYVVILSWIGTRWEADKFLSTIAFLTVIFLIFAISLFIYNFVYKKEAEESDIILMLLNGIVYFGIGYFLMNDAGYKDFIGFFAFALSAFYFVLGSFSYQKFKESSYLTLGFLGISIFFLTIAVPLQVKEHIITIVWSIEAVSLLLLGFLINSQKLRVAALIIYVLVVVRLFAFDTQIVTSQFILIFNKRFLTFIISAISMGTASYFYAKYREKVAEDERIVLPALLITLNIVLIWMLSWESISYYARKIEQFRQARLQSAQTDIRVLGMRIAQEIPATESGQIFYNYPSPSPYKRNIPTRYTPPRQNYNYQLPKTLSRQDLEKIKCLENARDVSLSIIWLLYSVALLGIGIVTKYKPIRLFALGFLMLTIIKVFVYDSKSLQQGYRIVAFMILGIILLATSFIYQRYKTQISSFLLHNE